MRKAKQVDDSQTAVLIARMDIFLSQMQVVADRLVAKLDEQREHERTDDSDHSTPPGS